MINIENKPMRWPSDFPNKHDRYPADKEQLKHYQDDRTELFAYFNATKYDLDIEQEKAAKLLRK